MMHAIERSSLCNEEEEQQQRQQQQQPEKKVSQLFAQRAALRLQDQRRSLKPADLQVMQACPRCQSLNTKFCYYNNYSLTQPRHYCKNCRRYWTAGGTLRNLPVGGGCRKKKKHAGKQLHEAGQSSGIENSETHELSAAAATTTAAAEQQQQHALLVGFSASSSSSTTRFTQSSLQGLETSIIGQGPTRNISARLGQHSSSQPFESGNIMSLGLFNSVMRSRAEEKAAAGLSSHPARAATSQQVVLVHDAGGDNLGGFFDNPVVYSSREGGGALGLTEEGHHGTYNHTEGHGEEVEEAAASYGRGEIIWRNLQQPKQEVLWGQEESIQGGGALDLNRPQEAKAKFSTPSLSPAHHGLGPHEEAAQPVAWQQPTGVSQGLGMPHYETIAPNTNFWSKYWMATP
jgi:hypothetical protein